MAIRDEETLRNALRVGVRYEIEMLQATQHELVAAGSFGPHIDNAVIESFLISARNVFGFLSSKGWMDDVLASQYVTNAYSFQPSEKLVSLTEQINKQISHLTFGSVGATALGREERQELYIELMEAVERFAQCLKPEFIAEWQAVPILTSDQFVKTEPLPDQPHEEQPYWQEFPE